MWVLITLGAVVVVLVLVSVLVGTSAKRTMPVILRELDKSPLNVTGLMSRTGKNRRTVLSSLLTMQDLGYIRTGTKGGMKKLSAMNDRTVFYITSDGREYFKSMN